MAYNPKTRPLKTKEGNSVSVPVDPKPKNKKKKPRVVDVQRVGSNLKRLKHKEFRLLKKLAAKERSIAMLERVKDQQKEIDWDSIGLDDPIPFVLTDKGEAELTRLEQERSGQEQIVPVTNEGQHRIVLDSREGD